jgi:hypothetical protein
MGNSFSFAVVSLFWVFANNCDLKSEFDLQDAVDSRGSVQEDATV